MITAKLLCRVAFAPGRTLSSAWKETTRHFSETACDVPQYKSKPDETLDERRARLLYQSRKRGILENGLLLSSFAAKHLKSLSQEELLQYDQLINLPSNDWELYYWITGKLQTPTRFDTALMDKLKNHVRNTGKEPRLFQPSLN